MKYVESIGILGIGKFKEKLVGKHVEF